MTTISIEQAADLQVNWTALRKILADSLTLNRNLVAEAEAEGYLRSAVRHYEGRCEGLQQAIDAMNVLDASAS